MAQICSDADKHIADLEAKVRFAETRGVEIAAEGSKNLKDFESGLGQKLGGLREMYADKIRTIGGLCSPMSVEEPLVEDCLNWFSEELTGLPDMFCSVNETFVTAAIEGALTLVGDSIDFDAM
jgi:hypothetical protein